MNNWDTHMPFPHPMAASKARMPWALSPFRNCGDFWQIVGKIYLVFACHYRRKLRNINLPKHPMAAITARMPWASSSFGSPPRRTIGSHGGPRARGLHASAPRPVMPGSPFRAFP